MHVKSGQLDVSHGRHTFKLKLRDSNQRIAAQPFDQLFAQRQQNRGVARGVLELRFGQLEIPVAEPFSLVYRFIQIARSNRFQAVTLFDVAGADNLAGQQRVKQAAEIHAECVLDKFRIKLCVVRDLDRTRSCQQPLAAD